MGLLLAGCGEADSVEVGGIASSTALPSAPAASSSGPTASLTPSGTDPGAADLTIVLDEGGGKPATWRLTCDPVGGNHPDPQQACSALGRAGAQALATPRKDIVCDQRFGGPQQAKITGTWRGQAVSTEITRRNGCEISRWDALAGLLPPATT